MKKLIPALVLCILINSVRTVEAQVLPKINAEPGVSYPWKDSELLQPVMLAATLKTGNHIPYIYNIGVVEDIPHAIHIGRVDNDENLNKFKAAINTLPKNATVVIYCGCCPFTKCPNICPAYNALKSNGFENIKVLNLSTNLNTDWIKKGYPLANEKN